MTIANYSDLQDKVAERLHRDDLTTQIQDSIALTEAVMQTRLNQLDNEATANVTVTGGVGTIPSDYQAMRSVYWSGTTTYELEYITPELFDARQNISSDVPSFYTLTGGSIKVSPSADGTAVMTYFGVFTALSDANPTNSILTNHPDIYLYGALFHACIYTQDDAAMQKYGTIFNATLDRVQVQDEQRRYGGQLKVRAR